MPEFGAAFAAAAAEGGAADAAYVGAADLAGGIGATAETAGGIGALDAAAGAGALGAGEDISLGYLGGEGGPSAMSSFGDATAGFEGLTPGTAGTFGTGGGGGAVGGGGGGGLFDGVSSLWQKMGGGKGLASMFGKGGGGLGIMQMLAGLYGMNQSSQLSKMARQPNVAGEQAVTRSLAAQGYQGSGNMMAALSQYGINGSQAAATAGMSPLVGQLSSLGLLTSGAPAVASLFGGT